MKCWKLFIVCCLAVLTFSLPAGAAGVPDGVVVVQQGQTLKAIAAQHKVSVAQLCQWNNLSSPDKVRVGQKLYVRPPDAAMSPSGAPAENAPPSPAKTPKSAKHAAPAPAPAPTTPSHVEIQAPDGVPENVKQELANVGRTLVNNAARTIMPNIKSKAVAPGSKGGYVASYMEVDAAHVQVEVIPSSTGAGKYIGAIRYMENQYECPGASKAEALQAACRVAQSRRIKELISYEKGKWHY